MLSYYKIRIDTDDRTSVTNLLDKYCDTYIISFENQETDNPHCHGYIETTTKQQTFRANIRKRYGAGNGGYSLVVLDEQYPLEYLAYMIKDGDYLNRGVPQETLDLAIEHDKKVKLQMKEKKASRRTTLQVLQDEYSEELIPRECENYELYKGRILTLVIKWYKEKGTLIRQFMIVSQVQTLLLKYYPLGDKELWCALIDKI